MQGIEPQPGQGAHRGELGVNAWLILRSPSRSSPSLQATLGGVQERARPSVRSPSAGDRRGPGQAAYSLRAVEAEPAAAGLGGIARTDWRESSLNEGARARRGGSAVAAAAPRRRSAPALGAGRRRIGPIVFALARSHPAAPETPGNRRSRAVRQRRKPSPKTPLPAPRPAPEAVIASPPAQSHPPFCTRASSCFSTTPGRLRDERHHRIHSPICSRRGRPGPPPDREWVALQVAVVRKPDAGDPMALVRGFWGTRGQPATPPDTSGTGTAAPEMPCYARDTHTQLGQLHMATSEYFFSVTEDPDTWKHADGSGRRAVSKSVWRRGNFSICDASVRGRNARSALEPLWRNEVIYYNTEHAPLRQTLDRIIVHHTNGNDSPRSIELKQRGRGFAAIGYHFPHRPRGHPLRRTPSRGHGQPRGTRCHLRPHDRP